MTEERHDKDLGRDEEDFARRAGQRLRESADQLDAATLSRLNRARQKALAEIPGETRDGYGWWVPAGVTAVAAIVAVGLWQADRIDEASIDGVPVTADEVADLEILLEEGELEMLEDLEFFAWLATEELEAAG